MHEVYELAAKTETTPYLKPTTPPKSDGASVSGSVEVMQSSQQAKPGTADECKAGRARVNRLTEQQPSLQQSDGEEA